MKVLVVLTLLAYCLTFGSTVFAKTPIPDAFDVDDTVREQLGVSEEDTVFRVYGGYFLYGFSISQSLDEIFADGWSLKAEYYVIASQDENGETSVISKHLKDGEVKDTTTNTIQKYYGLIDQNDRILGALGSFVKAKKTIYLHGPDTYIYYETNIGEYIYYTSSPTWSIEDPVEYLVPLDTFYELIKPIMEHILNKGGVTTPRRGEPWGEDWAAYDLSNYTYRHRLVLQSLCGVLPVLLLAGGGVWIALRLRKKRMIQG